MIKYNNFINWLKIINKYNTRKLKIFINEIIDLQNEINCERIKFKSL